jgi:hypothetical protein
MESNMRATLTTIGVIAIAALLAPAALLAAEPTAPNAAQACKAERKADASLFAEMYKAAEGSKKKPFPTCIATKRAQAESVADATADASKNAAKWCKAERRKSELNTKGEIVDPWGTPIKIYFNQDTILIRSAGANRVFEDSKNARTDDLYRSS